MPVQSYRQLAKRKEREAAAILKTNRVPSLGIENEDIYHPCLYIEHKHRARFPEYFNKAWNQLSGHSPDKVPALIQSQKGSGQQYITMRLEDFMALMEDKHGCFDV